MFQKRKECVCVLRKQYFIQQGNIALIKNDRKDIYGYKKIIYFKRMPFFELSIYIIESWKKKSRLPQKCEAAQLFSTLLIIRNVTWAANQHIQMISEDHETLKTGVMMLRKNLHENELFTFSHFKDAFIQSDLQLGST